MTTCSKRMAMMILSVLLMTGFAADNPLGNTPAKGPERATRVEKCPQVPGGVRIGVRLLESIDSENSTAGETFRGTLEEPLQEEGTIIAERGSEATVRLVRVLQPEEAEAPPLFALKLVEITVDGERCPVVTGFAKASGGFRKVEPGKAPEGTTSTEVILDAILQAEALENPAVAVVHGAGVSFQVVKGQRLKVSRNVVLHFTVPEVLEVGPRKTL